ncbi:uncharacterized protein LOC132201449 [Neocloeon triangulifer]|uniref:uncharacterized protein LOC132201449 n=1 Tax=Neocloeon triangulifer TaxID=2078957 RepID=UPI00286F1D50|nr:uncharacterized protein LOC132201449 [Neocloeon triangulifer]
MLVQEKVVLSVWVLMMVSITIITDVFKIPLVPLSAILYTKSDIRSNKIYKEIREDEMSRKLSLKPKMTSVNACAHNETENQNRTNHNFLILRKKFTTNEDLQIFLSASCSYLTFGAPDSDWVPKFATLYYPKEGEQFFSLVVRANLIVNETIGESKMTCGDCQEDFCYTDSAFDFFSRPNRGSSIQYSDSLPLDDGFFFYLPELFENCETFPSFCRKLFTFGEIAYYTKAQEIIIGKVADRLNQIKLSSNLFFVSYIGSSLFSLLLLATLYKSPLKLPGNHCLVFHALTNLITNLSYTISASLPQQKEQQYLLSQITFGNLPFFTSIASVIWITLYSYDCYIAFNAKGRITDEMKVRMIKTYHIIVWTAMIFICGTFYICVYSGLITYYNQSRKIGKLLNFNGPRCAFYSLIFILNFKAASKIRSTIESTRMAAAALNRKMSLQLAFLRLAITLDLLNDVYQVSFTLLDVSNPFFLQFSVYIYMLGEPILYSVFFFAPKMLKYFQNSQAAPKTCENPAVEMVTKI